MKTCLLYTGGGLAAIIAIVAGVVIHLSQVPNDIAIRLDESTESMFHPQSLTPEQVATYEREGVVFVPSLLSERESIQLRDAGEYAMSRSFSVSKLFGSSLYSGLGFDLWRTSSEVASLALQALPKVAASILSYSRNEQEEMEFRLLRDAMFQYKAGGAGCGWHVDDMGFWPTEEDSDGPTIWIALDEIKVAEGGGLAILNRTRFQEREPFNVTELHCRQTIKVGTCNMKGLSPECHAKMEESKLEWDMKPGDAIIWNRWTFHRGVAAVREDVNETNFVKRRYSVRYMPYGSKAGPFVHTSVRPGSYFDSPYYPQVWPRLKESEVKALQRGLEADVPLTRVFSTMLPFTMKMMMKKVLSSIHVTN